LVKILSQPQVRANRAKPIKEILAAGCVVHLLAVHEAKVAEPHLPSSMAVVWQWHNFGFWWGERPREPARR
jgi:hypothetical protein